MFKHDRLMAAVLLAGMLWHVPAQAAETGRGRMLYENHCTSCRESTVHVREKHKARTLQDIEVQVRRWAHEQQLGWSEEEIVAVRQFLQLQYYSTGK